MIQPNRVARSESAGAPRHIRTSLLMGKLQLCGGQLSKTSRYKASAPRRSHRRFGCTALGCVALAGWVASLAGCSDGSSSHSVGAKDSGIESGSRSDSSVVGDRTGDSQNEQGRDAGSDVTHNPDEPSNRDSAPAPSDSTAMRDVGNKADAGAADGPETGMGGDAGVASSDVGREDVSGRRTDGG